jgi:hypothetical protein
MPTLSHRTRRMGHPEYHCHRQKIPTSGNTGQKWGTRAFSLRAKISYALFFIWAMASSIDFFISSADMSFMCVAIDHLWPKGSFSLP